ncbi:LuxR C-terminal-related transcriptional regulator [Dactylosporangium fulvum]|uniref:LuxR C-terminal-related transcriptional regulator n=1 Tax=Dactylosporangium fulvum TaxID=53359 RepID=A0ABY5W5G7_9ACTN|nr:helix-turn-helix transcriptional regulator [Dactylosporangium fulvum]UWP84645.1 LuxR C-terminal-related transcriptional regulator [Dactylosporangium fulvum]
MRASRSGMSQVMVGRDDELRRLRRLVDGSEPSIAMLGGEPGIGKSRLVQELIAGLPDTLPVLDGQADPGTLSRPFEVLLDAIDSCHRSGGLDPELLRTVTDASRSMIDRIQAGLEIVRLLTTPGPSIVVFEDLHWADSESVALFERIADLGGGRLLVGTYRPDEVTRRHPLADLLTRLERRYTVTNVRLERLSLADTSMFLKSATGRPPTYRTALSLHNRTGGNPFFLEELLKANGEANLDTLCDRPLPWNVAEALRRQLDDLDTGELRIVEAAAVLGRKVPFDLLAAVTGHDENELIDALRDLVRRGLMVETGDDEFSFRHALTREALVDEMLGRQRRRLHELALETLLSTGSRDYALVAHHARGAGRYLDMVEAARRGMHVYLRMGSPYQALQLAEMGLDELPDDVELLSQGARAAWLAGLLDDAQELGRRWFDTAATREERADALRLLLRLSWEVGSSGSMQQRVAALRAEIEPLGDVPAKAHAFAAIAQAYMLHDDTEQAVAWADKAIALGEKLGLPAVWVAGKLEKGSALVNVAAGVDDGIKLLNEAAQEAEQAGEWLLAARALNNLYNLLPGGPADWAAALERMRTFAERAGFESLAGAAYFQGRARLAVQEGNLGAALAELESARRRDRGLLRTRNGSDYHGVFFAGLLLESGELDKAETVVRGLVEQSSDVYTMLTQVSVPGLQFHLACKLGRPDQARGHLRTVLDAVGAVGVTGRDFAHDLISAGLAAGLTVDELRPVAEAIDDPLFDDAWRWLADGQLAEASGDHSEALRLYRAAVAEPSMLLPAQRGSGHLGAARCLLAAGHLEEAREHVRAAEPLLARWAGWRVAELTALRGRLGLAAPAPAGAGDQALTPREREVATLLAEGLTNAELARRLYISPRTAAVHVSNILSKLNLESRTQIAAWVRSREPA